MRVSLPERSTTDDEGFTLIELLVVVIIIGLLAAIAMPVFLNQRKKAWDAEAKSDLTNAATAEETRLVGGKSYARSPTGLRSAGWRPSPNTTLTVVSARDAAGNVVAWPTVASGSFCLRAASKSGTVYYYDSATGGLQSAPCL